MSFHPARWIALAAAASTVALAMRPEATATVRLATFNIEMFPHGDTAILRVAQAIAETDADILGVQEIRSAAGFWLALELASAITERGWTARLARCTAGAGLATGVVYDAKRWRPVVIREHPDLLPDPIVDSDAACPASELSGMLGVFDDGEARIGVLSVHFRPFPSGYEERQVQWRRALGIARAAEAEFGVPIAVLGDMNSTGWSNRNPTPEREYIERVTAAFGFSLQTNALPCSEYWHPKKDGVYQPSMLDHVATRGGQWSAPAVHGYCARMACATTERAAMDRDYFEVSDHCPVSLEGVIPTRSRN